MFLSEGRYLEYRSSIFYGQLYNQTKLWFGRDYREVQVEINLESSLVDFHLSSSVRTLAQVFLFFAESTLFFSRHIFFLKAVIIRLLTSNPLMRDYFKIFSIISVNALSAENDINEIDARINRRNKEHYSFYRTF